jgi:anaerobic selenocysteine-containing dehydrogenase
MIATVEDGAISALKPDKDHPITKGFVCHKGIYGLDIHNDPDRLNTPLRRTPAGDYEEIDWETAITEIAQKLRAILDRHGATAIGSYNGNPLAFNSLFGPNFGAFMGQVGGTKNFSSGTQDCANKFAGSEAVFGTRTMHPLPDIENTNYLLIFGENPAISHMSFMSIADPVGKLREAEDRGAKIIFVNPRSIETARHVGEVLHIRPDTDVYFLAALIHEIDELDGFDENIIASHGENIDGLRKVIAQYPAERVAGITGIPAETIKQTARDFVAAPGAAAHMSTGLNMGRQGTLAYWLIHMLTFVTGNLGRKGGNFYSLGFYSRSPNAGAKGVGVDYMETPFGQIRRPGGVGIALPGNLMADYIANPADPIRAMFINAGNPILSMGGEARMRDALEELDLLVCMDIYRNATGEYADYVLPATDALEREDVNITGVGLQYRPSIQFTEGVVAPQHERKPEWWFYGRLCQAMGFKSIFDETDEPDLWGRVDAMLKSRDHTMDELRETGVIEFETSKPEDIFHQHIQTEDQRVDCCPPSFAPAIDRMSKIFGELEGESDDALKLITKRDAYMMNSWYANLPKMKRKERAQNYLFMHPDDAENRQLKDGQQVRVYNDNGAVKIELKVSDDLMPGVVAMTHGWGNAKTSGMKVAQKTPGANANALLPTGPGSFEPLSNQSHMTGVPVEVSAA